jgi:hypothetical protein
MVSSVSCYTDGETTYMVVVMRLKMPVDKWTIRVGDGTREETHSMHGGTLTGRHIHHKELRKEDSKWIWTCTGDCGEATQKIVDVVRQRSV